MTLPAPRLAAQGTSATPPAPSRVSCLDTISMTGATPRIVYLYATLSGSIDSRLGASVDEFAQSVAQHLRLLLAPSGTTLPRGEPVITWRAIDADVPHPVLGVTIRRDSAPTFRLITPRADSVAGPLLLRAADAAQQAGDGFFWPGDPPGDSLVIGLAFAVSHEGSLRPDSLARAAFPVFSVLRPHDVPIALSTGRSAPTFPAYPFAERTAGLDGVVTVGFVVDTTGRVDPASIYDDAPVSQPRLRGRRRIAHAEFFAAVKQWLPSARFTPARVGGCAVRQRMVQPFTFSIAR